MSPSARATPEPLIWVLVGTALLSSLAFWRSSLDVFGYPKFAVLIFGLAIAVLIAAHAAVATGRLHLPWGLPAWAAAAFGATVLLSFLMQPAASGFLGARSRHTGALFYLSMALAALLVLRAAGGRDATRWAATHKLSLGVVAIGLFVGGYGVLQMIGADPFEWSGDDDAVTATFGNPNFAAALVGITVPAAVWAAWDRGHSPVIRVTAAAALVAALVTAVGTRSVQGPVTAGVGLLVFSLAVLLELRQDRVRRAALGAWAVLTAAASTIGAASLLGRGPFGSLSDAANVDLRSFYWSAGVRMFTENPLTGVGFDRYGAYFGEFRSDAAARRLDLTYSVDAAHNVPIQLFATGGMFVGLSYVAFVVLTGVALVRALRRTLGRERLLVGALGGVWAGYQVQSLVSIEVPPLALVHWLSAGAIVAWSGMVEVRTVTLPWSSSRRKAAVRRRQRVSAGVMVVGLGALFVLMLAPLRAGTASARASALAAAERYPEALQELDEATSQVSWDPAYWNQLGDVALRAGQSERALNAYREALKQEPRSLVALVTSARIANQEGDRERAAEFYDRALEVEPRAPTLLDEAASFFDEHGDESRADDLRERADQIAP